MNFLLLQVVNCLYIRNIIFVFIYCATAALDFLDDVLAVTGYCLVHTVGCKCGFDFRYEFGCFYVHQIAHHKTGKCAVACILNRQIGNHIVQKSTEHCDDFFASLRLFVNYHCEGIRSL